MGYLVSVYIPTKNRAALLNRALNSVIAQTYRPLEIVVFDDGSTDETSEVVQKFKEKHKFIKYLRSDESRGACYARNFAIEESTGHYVTGLDDDDEMHLERVRELVKAYKKNVSFVTSDVEVLRRERRIKVKRKEVINLDEILYENLAGNQFLTTRRKIKDVGGYDEGLTAAQDYDLAIRLIERFGPAVSVSLPLQIVHEDHKKGRISNNAFGGYYSFYKKHKSKMNVDQRKAQLLNILKSQNKQNFCNTWYLSPPKKREYETLKYLFKKLYGLE